ncbi:MAG: hypothetical protein ACWA5P_10040 [bacterium]
METNLNNLYLLKAMDAFPWDLEKVVENLNYALSYEPDNANALLLMAKVHYEHLGNIELAETYFDQALTSNLDLTLIYPEYVRFLVNTEKYEKANELITYAFKVVGVDKSTLYLYKAYINEAKQEFEQAEEALKNAKMNALNNEFINFVDDIMSRISKKKKLINHENRQKEVCSKKEEKPTTLSWLSNRLNSLL